MLAQADSWWALVRLQDQTMITVDTEMTQRFGIDGAAPFALRRPKGRAQEVGEAFPVQRFDLDTNGHVNNGRFAEIACAYVPEPSRIRELMIEYKHSGHLGAEIVPAYTVGEDGVYVCLSRQEDGQPYIKMRVSYAETPEGRENI